MRLVVFLLCSVCATQVLAEQKIYRWIDENGQVHFGASPPDSAAERIKVETPSVSSGAVQSNRERVEAQRRMLDRFAREREIKREARQKREAEQRQRDRLCRQLKEHWRGLNYGGPVYYKDDKGGRDYLDEQERQAEKGDIAKQIEQACGKSPRP
jgi:hypothetical protein